MPCFLHMHPTKVQALYHRHFRQNFDKHRVEVHCLLVDVNHPNRHAQSFRATFTALVISTSALGPVFLLLVVTPNYLIAITQSWIPIKAGLKLFILLSLDCTR